jgi:alkylation response protein AidB-like acyl-CoA dehydrogenase
MSANADIPKGGSFLIQQSSPQNVFTPEDFTDEHGMIRDMTEQFVEEEVLPRQEVMEQQDWSATTHLLKRCADLGLLGIEVPTAYGGEDLDKVSAMIVAEKLARVSSFAVSYGGQSGIGTLPIVYFATEELKKRYLPALCAGEKLSAYALSEASSGSDALAAKASAVRSSDGSHWILNGEKMWITNAAFADMFVTFAQVDGKQFSCFIVEKSHSGVSTGAEEHKMGLKGSSTRTLVLENAKIPIDNLIGEIGKGHHVAFNILNIGRAKLAAGAVGGSKTALNDAVRYSKERIAFGKPIASFGAIRHKLAEMAIRTWITEGMVYRTAGLMDRALSAVNVDDPKQALRAIEEYAVECSILKVFASETLDFVVDEAVQVYGGYGYSADYPVERYYRDSRVNRIFEGTNEINRLLIPTMLLKRASAGRLTLGGVSAQSNESSSVEASAVEQSKKAFLFVTQAAVQKYGESIKNEQEVLMHLSNMVMEIYAMDTALHRAGKSNASELSGAILRTFINDAMHRLIFSASQVLSAVDEGEGLQTQLSTVRRLLRWMPLNTIQLRHRIAEQLIEQGLYAF